LNEVQSYQKVLLEKEDGININCLGKQFKLRAFLRIYVMLWKPALCSAELLNEYDEYNTGSALRILLTNERSERKITEKFEVKVDRQMEQKEMQVCDTTKY
jgi:hypothetical protein